MLRITKQTDYGIVLLTHMANEPERLSNAPEIAAEVGLPQPIVSKVLKLLARDGLLESTRGVHGGYRLARRPEEISVAAIIESLEGPIAITECIDESDSECRHEGACAVEGNWQIINSAIREALEQISLAQMTGRLSPAAAGLVQIGGLGRESAGGRGRHA